ncbi:MAG: DUF1549 domain-containing protein [Pedosphaera sp.]|nr:DUF1549 domain-containing protein [Pedosphaera sp.]
MKHRVVICFVTMLAAGRMSAAASDVALFEKTIRPILAENCFKCHSHAENKFKGGLALDSPGAILKGGETGPAIVPGQPEKSLLLEAVRQSGELKMPPKGRLTAAQISSIEQWIKSGATMPATASNLPNGPAKRTGEITDENRAWWAFQPVRKATVPKPEDASWSRNTIDRFILARIEKEGLKPAPEAARAALIRRLSFDLVGLPPTPAEVAAFVNDKSADAYEKLADRLLASPRHGERWARHWLDLVRYADSDGYRIDDFRPQAWRYRDYVIQSFNDDKPYDRFVQEQLAGDELFPGDPAALTATGYLRHWIYEYNQRDVRGQWTTILNDITDTTADVFLGLGLQCARCHDHKFDPILQKDYFRLQAFLAPILPREDLVAATDAEKRAHAIKLAEWENKTASLRTEINAIESKYRLAVTKDAIGKFPEDIQAMILKPVDARTPIEHQLAELAYRQVDYEYARLDRKLKGEDKEKVLALRKQLAKHDGLCPTPLPVALAVSDVGRTAPSVFIPKKGNDPVAPGFPTVLDEKPAVIPPLPGNPESTGHRAALARWLTRPDNPLTARVIVNRVWQQHFGRGLAANASDFGKLGEAPTHPELLDWLAGWFVENGWSLKKLHRLIVTSATYREAAAAPRDGKDPENKFYARATTRRLDAEQIRDAVFSISGELKPPAGGPAVNASEPHRSVYTKILRNTRDPLLDVFDAPLWFQSAASRDTTTTPVQSLMLINSQFMLHRAKSFASHVWKESGANATDAQLVERAYQTALGRAPTATQRDLAVKFLAAQPARISPALAGSAQAAFLHDKLPHRDGQAAVIVPDGPQRRFVVPHAAGLPGAEDFTIESFVLLRSVFDSGAVRTLAAKWNGDVREPGWSFGITGRQSRRKPQTLVLQCAGKKANGTFGEEAIFSDQHIQLNKPYYLAAAVRLARDGKPGEVTFYVKDLSNDDEPLLVAKVAHQLASGFDNKLPFTIGMRGTKGSHFDGLVDDVRLSRGALDVEHLLFTNEAVNKATAGYWQFEAKPDVLRDSSGHGLDIQAGPAAAETGVDTRRAALADFCHALLNSNEFLYVE